MKQLRLIIFREYLTKVRNKSFLLMTLLSPLAVVVLSLVIGYLTQVNSNTKRHIQVLDLSGSFVKAFEADAGITYSYTSEVICPLYRSNHKSKVTMGSCI